MNKKPKIVIVNKSTLLVFIILKKNISLII